MWTTTDADAWYTYYNIDGYCSMPDNTYLSLSTNHARKDKIETDCLDDISPTKALQLTLSAASNTFIPGDICIIIVAWTYGTFENNFVIKHKFTKYLKGSCSFGSEQHLSFAFLSKRPWSLRYYQNSHVLATIGMHPGGGGGGGGALRYLGGYIRSLSKLKNTPKALISGQKAPLSFF